MTQLIRTQNALPVQAQDDSNLIHLWLRNKRSANTRKAYARDAADFFEFVQMNVHSVTLTDFMDYRDHLEANDMRPSTVRRKMNSIKSLFSFAQKIGYTQFNVGAVAQVPRKVDTKVNKILDTEEAMMMIMASKDNLRDHVMLRIMYSGGFRIESICAMKVEHLIRRVIKDKLYFQVNVVDDKNGARQVRLSHKTSLIVEQYLENHEHEYLFPGRNGQIHTNTARNIVTKYAELAGIEKAVTPHWMRHTHINDALEAGASTRLVSNTVGATLQTLETYKHARPDESSADYLNI